MTILKVSWLLILLGWSLAIGKDHPFKGHKVYRILVKDQHEGQFLKSLEDKNVYDFWTGIRVGAHVDVETSPQDAEALKDWMKERSLEYSIMINDVAALMELEQVPAGRTRRTKGKIMDWISYHGLEDMYQWFDYLEATFDFCQKEIIGQSYEGQDMIIMKVCRGGCGKKPAMWIDSGIHAREWIAPAVGTYMLNELVENDVYHPELTQNLDWYFLPVHNPDGYRFTRSDVKNRKWRKTRSQYPGDPCQGTDGNRNWGFHWGESGASNFSCSDTYHGPARYSEVEVRNVRDFVTAHLENIKFFQSLHSYSQLVMFPWAYTKDPAHGHEAMLDLAKRGNEALYATHNVSYGVGSIAGILYEASGNSVDWALGVAGIPYAYTIELRPTGEPGFLLPPDQIIPNGEEIWAFHVVAAKQIISEFGSKSDSNLEININIPNA